MSVHNDEVRIKLTDENLNQYHMYLNGHGNIKLSDKEVIALSRLYSWRLFTCR